MSRPPLIAVGVVLLIAPAGLATPARSAEISLAAQIRRIEPNVIAVEAQATGEQRDRLRRMIGRDVSRRLRKANLRDVAHWQTIDSRADWEESTRVRIAALRRSLGRFPEPPDDLHVRVTRRDEREGFVVENIVFESRSGLLVTAHRYRPLQAGQAMPGIVISHSHHRPKEQGELQDMGANWARRGCVVIVPDHVGHGERRQHPFVSADDYDGEFRVSRQDYYFRYNLGMQLHIAGDSLMGWMVWDLSRCVDLLLSEPGIDKERIIMLGAVAGGGDPCGVAAALDSRIAAAVPFNFGGPQPESPYPLPEDAETTFSYSGSGSWESTRNLRLTARDGFFHYVIVGSIAPRKLIYAHEFSWDRPRDPVWKRFQTIWGDFYGDSGDLAFTHGYGRVTLQSSKASHCTNIGTTHRQRIDAAFERWFGIAPPDEGNRDRREREQTLCLAGPKGKEIRLRPVCELAAKIAAARMADMQRQLAGQSPAKQRELLRAAWTPLLGDVEPFQATVSRRRSQPLAGGRVDYFLLRGEREIEVPVVVLFPKIDDRPASSDGRKFPAVVLCAQSGKAALLQQRAGVIGELLESGVVVCLPDLRGTGETSPSRDRGRRSAATGISSSELMLGQTLVGSRLKDLRTVLAFLRTREEIDAKRMAVWGDSLAEVNDAQAEIEVPLGIDDEPKRSEPLGFLLALLIGLYEEDVAAIVAARGGLPGWRTTLESPFCHFPHDIVIPAVVRAGDLTDLAATLAPRPLLISGLVSGLNRRISAASAAAAYKPARAAYGKQGADEAFSLRQEAEPDRKFARWLVDRLQR